MKLSVIIATFNRRHAIANTLDALRAQTFPAQDFEVIITDDASSDGTGKFIHDYIGRHSLTTWQYLPHTGNAGKPTVVNHGIRVASAPLVAFTDDDIVPSLRWVAAHVARHGSETRPVVIVGKVSYPEDWIAKSNLVRYHNSLYVGQNKHTTRALAGAPLPVSMLAGGNFSVPRSILVEVGMYDERLRRGQDSELAIRLQEKGLSIVYEPDAAVIHYAEESLSYKKWLNQFQKFYIECAPHMIQTNRAAYYTSNHWFVEPPELFQEPLLLSLTKLLCRSTALPRVARWVAHFMEEHDPNPHFYRPLAFKYMMLCAAVEAVKARRR